MCFLPVDLNCGAKEAKLKLPPLIVHIRTKREILPSVEGAYTLFSLYKFRAL